jgi:hypothetical protein
MLFEVPPVITRIIAVFEVALEVLLAAVSALVYNERA